MIAAVTTALLCGIATRASAAPVPPLMQVLQTPHTVTITVEPIGLYDTHGLSVVDRPDLARLLRALVTAALRSRGVAVGERGAPLDIAVGSTVRSTGLFVGTGAWHETVVAVLALDGRQLGMADSVVT